MTDKATLEEIEALAKGAVSNDWDVYAGEVRAFAMSGMLDMAVSVECDSEEKAPTLALIASAPRLLEIAQEQAAEIARLRQYTCESCADADSCDRVGRAANRQCAAFRVVTKK